MIGDTFFMWFQREKMRHSFQITLPDPFLKAILTFLISRGTKEQHPIILTNCRKDCNDWMAAMESGDTVSTMSSFEMIMMVQ